MKTVVTDASTLIKRVLPGTDEQFTDEANAIAVSALAGKVRLLVPSLWFYEVGNILARRIPDQANLALDHLRSLLAPWTQSPTPDVQRVALDLTRRHGVTFYDAVYHALALVNRGVLVTADERYVRQVGASEHLVALSRWSSS